MCFRERLCFLVPGVMLFGAVAMAQAPSSIFQLNGDPANDNVSCTYGPCDYFNLINLTGSSGSNRGHSSINTFVSGTSTTPNFTGGGSKDPADLNQWAYTIGNTPNKDTLNAAYAAAYNISDFDVVFGADRLSPNGDANIGIWFFQQSVGLSNGTFVNTANGQPAHHVNGDVFIISAFTGGGGNSTISAYKWDSSCASGVKNPVVGQCADNNLRVLETASTACGSNPECAITNNATVSASWASYSGGSIAPPLFFEGGLDISSAFGSSNVPCFASFLMETRSAQSTTAVLKDFLLGSFPVCSMSISKQCGTPSVSSDGSTINYPVNGTVTNTGAGTLFDVRVFDCINGTNSCVQTSGSPLAVTNNTTGSPRIGTSSLAAGETGSWSDTSSTTAASQSDQAFATAATSSGGAQTVTSTNTASATCSLPVNSTLNVSKSCSTSLQQAQNGTIVGVLVSYGGQVCNTGNSAITNVALTDYPNSVANPSGSGSIVKSGINLGPAGSATACIQYSPINGVSLTYTPTAIDETINNGTGAGRYFFDDLITISSATATVGTLSQCQSTDPSKPCFTTDPRIVGKYGFATARCPICPQGECATQ